LSAIAKKNNLASWRDIYYHPDNAAFRRRRPNPDVIFPGDVVMLPDSAAGAPPVAPPPKPSRLETTSFMIRQVIVADSPVIESALFKFQLFQIVDIDQKLTAFYQEGAQPQFATIPLLTSLGIGRAGAFSRFQTPQPVAVTSFEGEATFNELKLVPGPGTTTIRIFIPAIEGQTVNLNIMLQGFADDNPSLFASSTDSRLTLVEETPRPFIG
jgi:hypothetical protein